MAFNSSDQSRIRHTVVFKLLAFRGSTQEQGFLAQARQLALIPVVEKFEILPQISLNNSFDWGLSMELASQQVYDHYNNHPDHTRFVEQCWLVKVRRFLEIDYLLVD